MGRFCLSGSSEYGACATVHGPYPEPSVVMDAQYLCGDGAPWRLSPSPTEFQSLRSPWISAVVHFAFTPFSDFAAPAWRFSSLGAVYACMKQNPCCLPPRMDWPESSSRGPRGSDFVLYGDTVAERDARTPCPLLLSIRHQNRVTLLIGHRISDQMKLTCQARPPKKRSVMIINDTAEIHTLHDFVYLNKSRKVRRPPPPLSTQPTRIK